MTTSTKEILLSKNAERMLRVQTVRRLGHKRPAAERQAGRRLKQIVTTDSLFFVDRESLLLGKVKHSETDSKFSFA